MGDTAYLHRIEYSRRLPGGRLAREYTEHVQDHGWYLVEGEQWRTRYTRGCAVDFLARTCAAAGIYAVVVWRVDGGETTRVSSVGLEWHPSPG
ncbi:MAG TPA: hypothetical protein VGP03_00255 [Pseudonocardiaceae bacterium]|nr:hypothetical protein [Pseudonocardiaceae bacterium]